VAHAGGRGIGIVIGNPSSTTTTQERRSQKFCARENTSQTKDHPERSQSISIQCFWLVCVDLIDRPGLPLRTPSETHGTHARSAFLGDKLDGPKHQRLVVTPVQAIRRAEMRHKTCELPIVKRLVGLTNVGGFQATLDVSVQEVCSGSEHRGICSAISDNKVVLHEKG
jgi:hypothetical protein